MSGDTEMRIILVLAEHDGGWIRKGTGHAHCRCGHRARLGDLHMRHVAEALMAELGLS